MQVPNYEYIVTMIFSGDQRSFEVRAGQTVKSFKHVLLKKKTCMNFILGMWVLCPN